MAKKDTYTILKTETVNLNFYAVRSKDGKWYRSKGMSGYGDSWVDDITKAKIYSKPGPAKTQVTFWAKHYPEYGIPDLVQITSGVCNYLDQTERVSKAIEKKRIADAKYEISNLEYRINNYLQKTQVERNEVESLKKQLEKAKANYENLLK